MIVHISSVLNCEPAKAWHAVLDSHLLIQIAKPLAVIRPVSEAGQFINWPARWEEGGTFFCKSYLFGLIPVGKRKIFLERVDNQKLQIQSRESDPLLKRWDHLITMEDKNGQTKYTDEIHIDAGVVTFFIWLWAQWFYRHRQRKWRKLAPTL